MASTSAVNRLAALLRDTVVGLVRQDGVDLSARQLAVLLVCYLEDGPHTVRGLAERLDIAKPAVTRALDRLETAGLAARAPDPRDRRSVLVARTPTGAAYVATLRGLMQAAARASGIEVNAAAMALAA